MSNWYTGQKVVCIDKDVWLEGFNVVPGPQYGDVVTVSGWVKEFGVLGLRFREWTAPDDVFDSIFFRPLTPLEEQIERIESEGCPEPELQEA